MKKYSDRIFLVLLFLVVLVLKAQAEDGVTIKVAAKDGGSEIKLVPASGDYYELKVTTGGKSEMHNKKLVPTSRIKSNGGLEVFRGIWFADGNLLMGFYYCSPASNVCNERRLIFTPSGDDYLFSREEVTAFSENIAVRGVFYNERPVPLEDLTYQYVLEGNNRASELFEKSFGRCILDIGGEAIFTISEELEKESPNEWVFEDGCVTPLLVLNLKNQGELSEKAFSRYFDSLNEVTN